MTNKDPNKFTREVFEKQPVREYTVSTLGTAAVPVSLWFNFDHKDGLRRKVVAHYKEDEIVIRLVK